MPRSDLSADERALLDLEQAWIRAEIEQDVDTLRRVLDDRFIATFSSGRTVNKSDFIALFDGDGSRVMHACDLDDRRMVVDADSAVIVHTATMRGTRNGERYTARARVTATYVKRSGQWRILAEHLSALPSPS